MWYHRLVGLMILGTNETWNQWNVGQSMRSPFA